MEQERDTSRKTGENLNRVDSLYDSTCANANFLVLMIVLRLWKDVTSGKLGEGYTRMNSLYNFSDFSVSLNLP